MVENNDRKLLNKRIHYIHVFKQANLKYSL